MGRAKESLLQFDGRPLFPERIAYTVSYKLSDAEARHGAGGRTRSQQEPAPTVHAEYGRKARAGLLLHTGRTPEWLTHGVLAVPWRRVL